MEMTKCEKSSQVAEYGYDSASETLRVCYKSGGIYDYAPVPRELADKIKDAESVGKFVNSEIKPKFEFKRIPTPKPDQGEQREAA